MSSGGGGVPMDGGAACVGGVASITRTHADVSGSRTTAQHITDVWYVKHANVK